MKKNLSRMWRSGIAMLLAICMVVGMCPITAFATESEEPLHYVSLGASNTNGYGLDGYLPENVYEDPLAASKAGLNVYGYDRAPAAAYPAQVADALEEATGKEVTLHQLAISSMRVEEVRYLLDDTMEPDAYMNWRFTGGQKWFEIAEPGGVEVLRKAYRDSLTEADVVTLDLGWNNFGVFAFNNIKAILADGKMWKEPPEASEYMDANAESNYQKIKSIALEKLSANVAGADSSLKTKLDMLADILTYATLGACYNYDIVVEKIFELNPDATVVVLNIQNLADDLTVDFEGAKLPLGDIYGYLIDLVNLYRASESPYADKCLFADAGDVTTFLDELVAWNGDPTSLSGDMQDCFDMYDDSLYVRSIVEYMMVGQVLSGVFQGFRDMAAGYGLEVFKNDSKYTYEFALTRTADELLSMDLAALDFNNPYGADKDVEEYGAAVAQHLKNLRGTKPNLHAYDYVFENLLADLSAQKDALETQKENLPTGTPQTTIDEIDAGIAQLTQAIDMIVPAAKAEFAAKLEGVYNTYINTLNYAYDIVATIVQEAGKINDLTIDASGLNGFNGAADTLMGSIVGSFISGAMNKFNYELEQNGLTEPNGTVDPTFTMDETLLSDPAVVAVAVLAVRYELGNSFFAHPNPKGHDEITDAVMKAYNEGITGDDLVTEKVEITLEELFGVLQEYGPEVMDKTWETFVTDVYLDDDFQYVAIGDGSAESKSYADYLAAHLNEKAAEFVLEPIAVVNYAEVGNTVGSEIQSLSDVSEADLITVGFSNVAFLDDAIHGRVEMDWASIVGEENVPRIEDLMAQVKEKIDETDIPDYLKVMASNLVEAYAFSMVQYAVELPKLIGNIKAVNSEALVIIVGMSNPFKNITLALDENTTLDISEYVDYLVAGVAVHGTACALMRSNTIYVDARDVAPIYAKSEITMMDIAQLGLAGLAEQLYPSEAGHVYIAEKIMNMLNVLDESAMVHIHTEETIPGKAATCTEEGLTEGKKCTECGTITVNQETIAAKGHHFVDGICDACGAVEEIEITLWGDADGNGRIQTNDAKLILQYCAEMIGEEDLDLTVSDVDGNGKIQTNDAKLILQYCAEMIDIFPVEE